MAESISTGKTFSKADANAAGWKLDLLKNSDPFACHMFYFMDYRTGHERVIGVPMESFNNAKPIAEPAIASAVLCELLLVTASGAADAQIEAKLAHAAVHYAKATRSYDIWTRGQPKSTRLHCLLNVYPDKQNPRSATVRPVMFGDIGAIADYENVVGMSAHVKQLDAKSTSFAHCKF